MRQAIMIRPGRIEFRDVSCPAAGPGEILLRVKRIGVCGTDIHVNHGRHPFTSYPVIQGHEFSAVVEAVGVEATIDAAVDSIQKGGTIVILGVFGERPRIDLSVVGDRELSLVGTLMYRHEDYLKAVELIAGGDVITSPMVTRHFPFEAYLDAYRFIDEQGDETMKVMIDL